MTSSTPFLSLVVPTCDNARELRSFVEAARSHFATSLSRLEILVVDRGSRDGTRATAKALAKEFPGLIRLLRHVRGDSLFRLWADGLTHARGERVLTLPACRCDFASVRQHLDSLNA